MNLPLPTTASAQDGALSAIPSRDASTVRHEVLKRLRSAITLQELAPGARLVQTALAEQLGVSRMPVRDAITDLISEGLAEELPGGGAVVAGLSNSDMRAVYAVRAPLEIEAVRRVAAMPNANLTKIEEILERSRSSAEMDAQALWDLDREFHWAIYAATNNRFVLAALAPIWSQISRVMFAVHSLPNYSELAWQQHQEIADAIKAGDVDLAAKLTENHLIQSEETLLGVLEQ